MKAATCPLVLALFVSILAQGIPTLAAEPAQPPRYSLLPAGEGFLRLDGLTGAVSHCLVRNAHWVCESVADDRLALQEEIDRLARENAALKQQLEVARKAASGQPSEPPAVTLRVPQSLQDELKALRTYVEELYRGLRDFAARLSAAPEPRQL